MDIRELPDLVVGPPNPFGAPNAAASVPPISAGIMRLSFNNVPTSTISNVDTTGSLYHEDGVSGMREPALFNMGEQIKKKRGRPRKYGPDGNMALALSPLSTNSGYFNSSVSDPAAKRRGRPPGSRKKQQLEALGPVGTNFTPHVITIQAGEDVSSKILAFSQQGSRSICILSANGAINNVAIRQSSTSGETVTYEDRFEIISLSVSFHLTEDDDGTLIRTGCLSVVLAGSDGRVLGGSVAGMLKAATPVQVVLGSFIAEGKKARPETSDQEPSSAPNPMSGFIAAVTASPQSEGTSSESSDDPGSPLNQNGSNCNNTSQFMYQSHSWAHSANQARHDGDLKVMPN